MKFVINFSNTRSGTHGNAHKKLSILTISGRVASERMGTNTRIDVVAKTYGGTHRNVLECIGTQWIISTINFGQAFGHNHVYIYICISLVGGVKLRQHAPTGKSIRVVRAGGRGDVRCWISCRIRPKIY